MLLILKAVAVVTSLLILLQATLAGQFLFVDPDYLDVHEVAGNAIFMLVLAQTGLAFVERRSLSPAALAATALLVPAIVAQIGLGYLGRDSSEAASAHVPVGVLAFGVSVVAAQLTLAARVAGEAERG